MRKRESIVTSLAWLNVLNPKDLQSSQRFAFAKSGFLKIGNVIICQDFVKLFFFVGAGLVIAPACADPAKDQLATSHPLDGSASFETELPL